MLPTTRWSSKSVKSLAVFWEPRRTSESDHFMLLLSVVNSNML